MRAGAHAAVRLMSAGVQRHTQQTQWRESKCHALLATRHGFGSRCQWRDGGGSALERLCALPAYRLARKTEEDLAAGASVNGARFPFKDEFEVSKGLTISAREVIDTLAQLMTEERIKRIEQVCAARTFNVLPVVESIYDMGNLAAVCRSADALGFGALHVIRNTRDERYKQSTRSAAGADKWLDVQVFNSTEECLLNAKKLGYQVVVTHLSPDSVDISQIDWTRPTCFVMGNEERGVSKEAVALADACVVVPMVGFVDSFNLSVAAALIMYEARRMRERELGSHGDLTPQERALLKAVFFLRNKGQTREYIQHMLERPPPQWQAHRGGGDWGDKHFDFGSSSSDGEEWGQRQLPRQRLQTTQCHYWDGSCCWGERLVWPGKTCRYTQAHNQGVSTFNKEKLRQMCEKKGIPFPDLSAPPPPVSLPPSVAQPANPPPAAAAAEDGAAAAVQQGNMRDVQEALSTVAAAGGNGEDDRATAEQLHTPTAH